MIYRSSNLSFPNEKLPAHTGRQSRFDAVFIGKSGIDAVVYPPEAYPTTVEDVQVVQEADKF